MILSVVMLGAAGVALVLSVVLALRGVRERKAADSFTERAVVTTADVLETRPKDVAMSGEPVTIYFHLVRYEVDGEPVTAETMSGMEPPIPHVGERVEVRYDSVHPRRVVLDQELFADFGPREAPFAQAIVDHELAHVVGLGHVDDPGELMYDDNLGRTTYGPGDREGLARLGSISC